MTPKFTVSKLSLALFLFIAATNTHSAGLDRSGQPSADFSTDGTLAYVSAIHVSADITGKESDGKKIESVSRDYQGYGYGVKTDVNKNFSVGVFYDQPYGAKVEYKGKNTLVDYSDSDNIQPTEVDVVSHSLTGLIGLNFGEKNNFKIYGGPVVGKIGGDLTIRTDKANLAPENASLSFLNDYSLHIAQNTDYGYMVGAAYQIPEIALKGAVTYRSEIEHDVDYAETMPEFESLSSLIDVNTSQTTKGTLIMPESVNLDFQTGVSPTMLLTARARWVPWGDFKIKPPMLNDNITKAAKLRSIDLKEAPLLTYRDDSYLLELGLAKRLSSKVAISGSIGWDSGAGNPVSPLGPVEGYYSVGLGGRYEITPNWSLSAGGRYLFLGDAEGELSASKTKLGKFKDNNGYVVGFKLTYQAK